MTQCKGFVNIYRSGFHTPGKCGAFNRHPGDIYATEDAARRDIFPASHYVGTVAITWDEPVIPEVNP